VKDEAHGAISLPPTLRKKHAKDGAPTKWFAIGRLGHPPVALQMGVDLILGDLKPEQVGDAIRKQLCNPAKK
jgi:hypothetical protein